MDLQRRALVVEDYEELRYVYVQLLKHFGFAVEAFESPVDALRHTLDAASPPDLLVTDWALPGMTGTELAAAIRREERLRATRVLVISAGDEPEGLGDAVFLRKPFDMRTFQRAVRAVFGE